MYIIKILSIEPTPSPNVMKLNLYESLPAGVSRNFSKKDQANAPEELQRLLAIEGVQGVFQASNFIAVERHPKANWSEVLTQIGAVFGLDSIQGDTNATTNFGEVHVYVQMFKGIPSQVKLVAGTEEKRFGLPERFAKAIMEVQASSQNYILERKWEEGGIRYGTFTEIGEEVVAEITASYGEEWLRELVAKVLDADQPTENVEVPPSTEQTLDMLENPDWQKRFIALERINPTLEDIPMLARALGDPQTSIRRLATVYLGLIGKPESLPHLFRALKDRSPAVRRTAGDAISDIGDPSAIGPMTAALQDDNRLVRWRAARFLYEQGDDSAVPSLQQAQQDPEFEVALQAKIALERIERGEAASGTAWQQMVRNITKQ